MRQEKIISTIKKVLELSKNNTSEHEAEAAAAKAQELLAKYHIEMVDIEGIDTDSVEEITEFSVDVPSKKWKYRLARIVADNFRCKHYYMGKKVVVFYGHQTDAQVAVETFKYLFRLGNILAGRKVDEVFNETGTSAGIYNSFVKGFCDGVEDVLAKQCTALMLVTPQDVNDAFEEKTKGFKTTKNKGIMAIDGDAYTAGKTEGQNAMKSRQIEGK